MNTVGAGIKLASCPKISSITTSDLLNNKLVLYCYSNMFYGCSSLNNITCLLFKYFNHTVTSNWVSGVASSGTFYKNPNMNSWTTGPNGIPDGWTVIDNWMIWTPFFGHRDEVFIMSKLTYEDKINIYNDKII